MSEVRSTEEDDYWLCPNCWTRFESKIHRYNYRPRRFHYEGSPPYYGLEVETDHFPENAERVSKLLHGLSENERLFYIKHDGSLNNGLELVFHPKSIQAWGDSWYKVDNILTEIKAHNGQAFGHGTCGFHIHRSKEDMTKTLEIKLCLLLKMWKDRIQTVAQRSGNRYASWGFFDSHLIDQPIVLSPSSKKESIRKRKQQAPLFKLYGFRFVREDRHKRERYQCVNFGSNAKTIEFRAFKGTLFSPTLQAYIGFTHNFCEFAGDLLINELEIIHAPWLWQMFLDFLYKRSKQPFVTACLDFLSRKNIGHESWQPTVPAKNWKEV